MLFWFLISLPTHALDQPNGRTYGGGAAESDQTRQLVAGQPEHEETGWDIDNSEPIAESVSHPSWKTLGGVALAAVAAALGLFKLLLHESIKEGVKAQFDKQLEAHKSELDLQKQRLLKDFGLFAEKRHTVNTEVYVALRAASASVESAIRGGGGVVATEEFNSVEFDDFLTSAGLDLDQRKPLLQIHDIAPEIAKAEFYSTFLAFRLAQANRTLVDAIAMTEKNEFCLSHPVVTACDELIALLTDALSSTLGVSASEPWPPAPCSTALDAIPNAVAQINISMRSDLLGEDAIGADGHRRPARPSQDPRGPMFSRAPRWITIGPDRLAHLASYELPQKGSPLEAAQSASRKAAQQTVEAGVGIGRNSGTVNQNQACLIARAYLSLGQADKAVEILDAINARGSDDVQEVLLVAEALVDLRQSGEAGALLEGHWSRLQENAQARFLRGVINVNHPLDIRDSLGDFDAAIALDPGNNKARMIRAEVYRRLGQIARAIDDLDLVFPEVATNIQAQLTRIELLAESHRWPAVIKVSEQLLKLKPDNARAISLRGKALRMLGKPAEVLEFVSRFKTKGAAQSAALGIQALARVDLKDYEGALVDADSALQGEWPNSDAFMARARALAGLGKWDEATVAAKDAYQRTDVRTNERTAVLGILRDAYRAKHAQERIEAAQ